MRANSCERWGGFQSRVMMKLISAIDRTPPQIVGHGRLNSAEGIKFRGIGFHAAPGCDAD